MNKQEYSRKLIERIAEDFPQRTFYCFYSGGKDSIVSTHLVHSVIPERAEVVFIDTTICPKQTIEFIKSVCERFSWKLNIIRPDKTYDELVSRWGFPHFIKYRWCMHFLKLRPIKKFLRNKRAISVIGIRKDESVRRLTAYDCVKEFSKDPYTKCFVLAPLLRWTEEERNAYLKEYNLPLNPLIKIFNFSSDCFCLAYPAFMKLAKIRIHLPEIYEKLKYLETKVIRTRDYSIVKGHPLKEMKKQELISKYICPCDEPSDELDEGK